MFVCNLSDLQHSRPVAKNSGQFQNHPPNICICSARHFITWMVFFSLGVGAPAAVPVAIIKEIYAS